MRGGSPAWLAGRDDDRVDSGDAVEETVGGVDGGEGRDGTVRRTAANAGDGHAEGSEPERDLGADGAGADDAGRRSRERAARGFSPAAGREARRRLGQAPRECEEEGHGVLGDGHRVEAGHVGDPHPGGGGRVQVDVVDSDSELLDEPEAPRPDSRAGQRRPHRDDHVHGRPAIDQPRFEPCPTTSITARSATPGRPVLRHLRPGVVLGEPLLADKHPQGPLVWAAPLGTTTSYRHNSTVRAAMAAGVSATSLHLPRRSQGDAAHGAGG